MSVYIDTQVYTETYVYIEYLYTGDRYVQQFKTFKWGITRTHPARSTLGHGADQLQGDSLDDMTTFSSLNQDVLRPPWQTCGRHGTLQDAVLEQMGKLLLAVLVYP